MVRDEAVKIISSFDFAENDDGENGEDSSSSSSSSSSKTD